MKLSRLFNRTPASDPSTSPTHQGAPMSSTTPTDPQLNQLIDSVIANTATAQETTAKVVKKAAKKAAKKK